MGANGERIPAGRGGDPVVEGDRIPRRRGSDPVPEGIGSRGGGGRIPWKRRADPVAEGIGFGVRGDWAFSSRGSDCHRW